MYDLLSQISSGRRYLYREHKNRCLAKMNVNAVPFNIETAFRTHYGRVARIIARVVRDHARAEELAVEVFLKLWRTRNAQADKVEAWLYRVAVRTALDEATVSPQASIQLEKRSQSGAGLRPQGSRRK